jgi:hypothetical protein
MAVAALMALAVVAFTTRYLTRAPTQGSATPTPRAANETPQARAGAPSLAASAPPTTGSQTPVGTEGLVGEARGTLRFALPAGGGAPDVVLELKPQASVGLWLPGTKRLRIVLLDHPPDFVEATRTVSAIATNEGIAQPGGASAMIELAFIPTAQAYTPEEVESIRLLVVDAAGRQAFADITSSVQWSGALAAPEVSTAATAVQLQSTGSGTSDDAASRAQSWDFATTLPVAMRP